MEISKLKEHKIVTELRSIFKAADNMTVYLVGGAVIDILEGRVPRDYDIIVPYNLKSAKNALEVNGFKLKYVSKTATTFSKKGVIVQILNKSTCEFDFTISKAQYTLNSEALEIDEICFEHKMLVPNNFSDSGAALNSLSRIPHWIKKGYTIRNETYFSLLNCLKPNKSSFDYPYRS